MFRYVYAMSIPRDKALARASFYSDSLIEHLIKIVVYHDVKSDFISHWIGEISRWLYDAGSIIVKPDGKKLKPDDYMDTLFGWMGDDIDDYRSLLDKFQHDNKRGKFNYEDKKSYPPVETSPELCKELMAVCHCLIDSFISMLLSNESFSIGDYNTMLNKVLIKYL